MRSPTLVSPLAGPIARATRRWAPASPALLLAATLALGGCTASEPAAQDATPAAASMTSSAPQPTESLLEEDGDEHSAVGALPDGFPSDLVPVPDDAEILVSTLRPAEDGGLGTLSLNLRSTLDAAALVDSLRQPLLAAGFAEATPTQAEPGLAAQTTFTRDGGEMLVVGVLDRDGVRTLTVGGKLRLDG
ncbi:hypothetical protein QUV83_11795 [Cellulomonas cellasea]|uniref:hypothetical protein n=1 Tax=Cellulomonas cellasea TaxID=43670 RepID=UPI0025A399A7|nr:hypothetical protein [Cellulomonas cellasea]MDM8085449.1 hypothetical protein [Cellulomonas cellasea]